MAAAMLPYGPVRAFVHAKGAVFLGGNHHGILPEDRFDRQPLVCPGSRVVLVADVRLDNRADLARELDLTHPELLADSEFLLQAWLRWGSLCVHHLTGSFAFAVWNPATRELFATRDHVGERPLFFYRGSDFLAFSSMPKGLLALPGVAQGVNEDTILRTLTLALFSQSVSFFKGIERMPPGHFVRWTPSSFELTAYWRPFEAPAVRFKRDEDYVEAFLEIFDAAVEARLRTTGRVGSQLSSGLDSSSVTASAARLLARRGESMTSFTAVPRPGFFGAGLPGRLPDEGPGAADVARLYPNVGHVLLDSAGVDMVRTVKALSDAVDEPIHNSVNALWIAATLHAARAHGCNTLLVGARGNLTISHKGEEAMAVLLRRGRWLQLARTALSFRKKGLVSLRHSADYALKGLIPRSLHRRLQSAETFDLTYSPVNLALAETLGLRERMLEEFFWNSHDTRKGRLDLFQVYDFDTYTAGYQAMHGVDVRDPCADRRVLDFCFSIPDEQYIAGGVPRSLVRRAMRGRLPESTLTRNVRGQQGADWYLTVRDALPDLRREIVLNDKSPSAHRLLDLPRMRALLETFPELTPDEDLGSLNATAAWGDALCRGFSFGYFLRRYET